MCTHTHILVYQRISWQDMSHSRLTFRIKRNPLRTRRIRHAWVQSISIYITLSLLFQPATTFSPSFTWIPSFSPLFLFLLPCSRAHLIVHEFPPHSWRRTTVNTHLLDQPASSLASYSTLWPPTSKRRPGLWNIPKNMWLVLDNNKTTLKIVQTRNSLFSIFENFKFVNTLYCF